MKFAYLRDGSPLLDWRSGIPPQQSRAADAAALGSLGGTTLDAPTLILPRPGAPEPIGVTVPGPPRPSLMGCSCHGSCGCGSGLSGIADAVPGGYLTLGVGVFLLWRMLRKK